MRTPGQGRGARPSGAIRVGHLLLSLSILPILLSAAVAAPVDPAVFVGHRIGEDFRLVKWPKILEYFDLLARESGRVRIAELGRTTLGNRMIAAIISSPENLAAADKYRDIAARLAGARGLTEDQARDLAERGRAIVAITLNLHSTEIASSQMALELGYRLATDTSPSTERMLANAILLLIPSLNPDGQIMVCDWYEKGRGTPFEGGRLPWLYHAYAGHDNNRDFFMLNLVETRNLTRFLYQEWHPQALNDQHQMGTNGPRLFVPPYFDPINPNVHPLIWREIAVTGSHMAARLEEKNYAGVVSSATYDGWRPGDMDTTPWWHNVVALITEAASAKIASPVFLSRGDLTGERRGLPEYAARMNYPNPWPGGWWRLRDIVDYELTSALAFLESCACRKTDVLLDSYRMNRDAVERGRKEAPYAFVIPLQDNDPWTLAKLLDPLLAAGVELQRASESFMADGTAYPPGTIVVPMAQPLRPYAKDLLEAQQYPDRRLYPAGPPEPPYDEAGWTLPLKMGIRVAAVAKPFDAALEPLTTAVVPRGELRDAAGARAVAFSPESNAATIAVNRLLKAGMEIVWSDKAITAGSATLPKYSFVVTTGSEGVEPVRRIVEELSLTAHGLAAPVPGPRLRVPRVGLYQPWGGSVDEGWTRWLFERFELPFRTLHSEDIKAGDLASRFDLIVLPSMSAHEIRTGEASPLQKAPTLPPPYSGGLGVEGVTGLVTFVRGGGTLVALDQAAEFAIEALGLPVKNVLKDLKPEEFFCPGSILEVEVDRGHPVTAGLGATASIFFLRSPAFEIVPSFGDGRPAALAAYSGIQLLRSGWILGEKLLDRRAAVVEAPAGKGRAILIGFRSQFRGQTYGTFRLLFNAAYYAALRRGPARAQG
jgi:Zinc carboxypeptidase